MQPHAHYDETTCLNCPLAKCDESDPGCAYQAGLSRRTIAATKPPVDEKTARRREAWRLYGERRRAVMAAVKELRAMG